MSALPAFEAPRHYTVDDFLALDRAADTKSEYLDGEIFAMASASPRHVLIATNIARELGNRLKSSPCQVYASDLRVQASRGRAFHYPDVAVVCGRPEYRDSRHDTVTNPLLIVEVLSPSTRNYDRGDKFASYRQLVSLREYILIDTEPCHVEHFRRKEGGLWELSDLDDPGAQLVLASLDIAIPLQEIYAKVELLEPESTGEGAPEAAGAGS